MLSFNTYHQPDTLEDAYAVLTAHKRSQLIGGGAFIRMGNRKLTDVIDLSSLELDYIRPAEDSFAIGAMTNFHTLESSEVLTPALRDYFKQSLGQIVGIQLRNMVTVGGTVYSRYGFSDLNTALLALGGVVRLYKQEDMSIETFFKAPLPDRDILLSVDIPNLVEYSSFKSTRLSTADYALLNLAVVKENGAWRIAVGARPHRAVLAHETMAYLNEHDLNAATLDKASNILMSEIQFGSNRLASETYRQAVSGGLLKQALMEVMSDEN
jgi:CO/xanthine dehydrogenase FAD-binding subunit